MNSNDRVVQLRRKLNRKMLSTSKSYGLLSEGARIMVAVSGGKDSYGLFDLLWRAQARLPFKFEIIAVHLDQQQPGYDGTPLSQWLKDFGAPYEIISEDNVQNEKK